MRENALNQRESIDWLDETLIKQALNANALQQLNRLDVFDTIDSTNTYLLTHAKSYAESGCVCLAEEQTQGRGRQGKTWFSPKGANISCSILWKLTGVNVDIAPLSLAVAVMVMRALQQYGISNGIQLKWPNDIYFSGRKLVGILIESIATSDKERFLVIGVGINAQKVANHPFAETMIDVESIIGQRVNKNKLAACLINELIAGLSLYAREGFDAFLSDWKKSDMLQGQKVLVRAPQEEVMGVVQGIDLSGELLIDVGGDARRFRCGEVSVAIKP